MQKLTGLISLIVLVLAAGCASAPQRSEQLDSAHAAVQTLGADPLVQQAASEDLKAAQASLQDADNALQQKQPLTVVDHYAYLAQRHAESGEARIREAKAREELAQAGQERQQIVLAERAREADAAKAELAELKARQTSRGMVVTIGDVLFDTGKATLKEGATLTIDRLAAYMRENPKSRLRVEGFTDSTGSDELNDALSQRRADTVASALVSRGISADRLQAIGRGKTFPVASNDSAAGRQQNRRVEVVFSDQNGQFAQSSGEGSGAM